MEKEKLSYSEFAAKFFRIRFKRIPSSDKEYFEEWRNRFKSGHPESWMDKKSLAVYDKLRKGYTY